MSNLDFLIFFSEWELHNAFDNIDISSLRSNGKGCFPVLMRQPYAIIKFIEKKRQKQIKEKIKILVVNENQNVKWTRQDKTQPVFY